jgi:hypothetical protein
MSIGKSLQTQCALEVPRHRLITLIALQRLSQMGDRQIYGSAVQILQSLTA